MKLSPAQYAKLTGKPAPSKYGAKAVVIDGIRFHSTAEGDFYSYLRGLWSMGLIRYFIRQPTFDLPGGVTYKADFLVVGASKTYVIDVKGMVLKEFLRTKKMVEALYPVYIEVVKRERDRSFTWMPN